jgi:hypothetical protein
MMTTDTALSLTGTEYDLVRLRAELADLARNLAAVAVEIPQVGKAFKELVAMRRRVKALLVELTPTLAEASAVRETLEPAPAPF